VPVRRSVGEGGRKVFSYTYYADSHKRCKRSTCRATSTKSECRRSKLDAEPESKAKLSIRDSPVAKFAAAAETESMNCCGEIVSNNHRQRHSKYSNSSQPCCPTNDAEWPDLPYCRNRFCMCPFRRLHGSASIPRIMNTFGFSFHAQSW